MVLHIPILKTELIYWLITVLFTTENIEYMPSNPLPDVPSIVNPQGVQHLLSKLQTHKSRGPVDIPAYLLKEVSVEIAPV